jgi:CHASE3 domain sensor protein
MGMETLAKYVMVAWLVLVGAWVYGLRTFAKQQTLSVQNRQITIQLFSDIKDAESGQRGFLLTHDEAYLPQYTTAVRQVRADIRVLKQYLSDKPEELKTVTVLNAEVSGKLDELEQTIQLSKEKQWSAAVAKVCSNDGLHRMDRIRDLFDVLAAQERDELRRQEAGAF